MNKFLLLTIALFTILAPKPSTAVLKCIDKDGDLYITDAAECPSNTKNQKPPQNEITVPSRARGPLVFNLRIWMTALEVSKIYPQARYSEDKFLLSDLEVGGISVSFLSGTFINGYLEEVHATFESDGYSSVYLALVGKYGHPTRSDSEIVHNAFNAQFENNKNRWDFKDGLQIDTERYFTSLKESSLFLTSKEYRDGRIKTITIPKVTIDGF